MEKKYGDLLKFYNAFESENHHLELDYIYDGNLRTLIGEYGLDEIMGQGNEWEQLKALLEWISDNFISNNRLKDVTHGNARDIIPVMEEQGANSYTLSRLLTEFLLALGLRARYVKCIPFYYRLENSFSLVHVYSQHFGKWIMLDPFHNGYVLDEREVPLSLLEIRKGIAEGSVLLCPSTIHYNGQMLISEHYLSELAKYLFQFEINQVMGYGCVASNTNPIIHISPKGFDARRFLKKKYKQAIGEKGRKGKIPVYTTSNETYLA